MPILPEGFSGQAQQPTTGNYTEIRPLCVRQPSIARLRSIVEAEGGLNHAMAVLFERAQITLDVIGDPSLTNKDQGTLFAGDHRDGTEAIAFSALLGQQDREDGSIIAKATSLQARLIGSVLLDEGRSIAADDERSGLPSISTLILPVVPRGFAREKRARLDRALDWRINHGGPRPTAADINQINRQSLENGALRLQDDHVLVYFPVGQIGRDAAETRWYHGLGTMISLVEKTAREHVQVVPFRFDDDLSKTRLFSALRRAVNNKKTEPQTVTLRLGESQATLEQLFGSDIDHMDGQEIADLLQRNYRRDFRY